MWHGFITIRLLGDKPARQSLQVREPVLLSQHKDHRWKKHANPADAESIASALIIQHPEINAFYVPWDTPAEGVVAACRAAKRPDIKVVTLDLGANNGLDMVKSGNVIGIAADLAYQLGYTKAICGAYGLAWQEGSGVCDCSCN